MKSILHVLVVLAIYAKIADANIHYTEYDMTPIIAKCYMDINNKNELQTHQGTDSRHMQKVNCSDKKSIGRTLYSV